MQKIRPFFDENTPLGDVPEEWLREVEPKVMRGAFRPCWMWQGSVTVTGNPVWKRKGKMSSVKKGIALIFWNLPDKFMVRMHCRQTGCINPRHFDIKVPKDV